MRETFRELWNYSAVIWRGTRVSGISERICGVFRRRERASGISELICGAFRSGSRFWEFRHSFAVFFGNVVDASGGITKLCRSDVELATGLGGLRPVDTG